MIGLYARAAVGAILPRPSTLSDTRLERSAVPAIGELADYGAVCGFPLGGALPLTFPHVLGFRLQVELMAGRSFPLALPGLVHVANTITAHRPIALGERLDLRVHAERLAAHPRGAQVDLVTEVDVDGARAWEGRSTYLARGAGVPGGVRGSIPDLTAPEGPAAAVWRVPGDIGRRYAAVSGDVNPIHLSSLSARAFGFPRTIAHGMWTAARALASLQGRVPAVATYDVTFGRPLLVPSTVELVTEPAGHGWHLAVRGRAGASHLVGAVRPGQ